jgi:hypothetical protein
MGSMFSMHGREVECIRVLPGNREGKRQPGRVRLEDTIKMGGMEWIHLVQIGIIAKL